MKNIISAKTMEEIYVTYGLDEDTWNMFCNMKYHGLINDSVWFEFYDKCHGYTYGDDSQTTIVNEHLVTVYRMDEQGFMKRTA